MPCFICAKCLCIDNTATGHYWDCERDTSFNAQQLPEYLRKAPLCSECAPTTYRDGSPTGYGKWHGKFAKEHYSVVVARADKDELKHMLNLKDFI